MTAKAPIMALIMAGGQSRRMGENKAMMAFGGEGLRLIDYVMARIELQLGQVAVNLHTADDAKLYFQDNKKPLILCDAVRADENQGKSHQGPLAGIHAGLGFLAKDNKEGHNKADYLLTLPCDCPFFPDNLVSRLYESVKNGDAKIAIASSNNRHHPVIGLWHVSIYEDLDHVLNHAESRKIDHFIERHKSSIVSWDIPKNGVDPFFNLNTKQDFEMAQAYVADQS